MSSRIVLAICVLFATILSDHAAAGEFASPYDSVWSTFNGQSRPESQPRGRTRGAYQRVRGQGNCEAIRATVVAMTGDKAGCYMKLFKHESDCQVHLPQRKGNAGNPSAGYGICTLERSPALRAARGAACRDISTLEGQINCCRLIMKSFDKRGSYFGPVRRGEVAKCE